MTYAFKSKEVTEALVRVGNAEMGRKPEGPEILGTEIITVKTPAAGIDARVGVDCSSAACTLAYLNKSDELVDSTDHTNVTVYNTTEEDIAGDQYIAATRQRGVWVASVSSGGVDPPKRVKFKLNEKILKTGSLQSGYAEADVIDPMNSGLVIGDTVTVWDYKKQFVMSDINAIGIAVKGNPYGSGSQWHIEEVEQLVNKVRGTLASSLGPWMAVPDVTLDVIKSTWPYTIIPGDESLGSNLGTVENYERHTANGGWVECEMLIPASHQPDPDNETAPYTLEPIAPAWNITACQNPTARWTSTIYENEDFVLGGGEHAEGEDPLGHDSFSTGDSASPPSIIWDDVEKCRIKDLTGGWAFLDDKLGVYVTISTASALFGLPEVVEAVAHFKGDSGELIDNATDCGVIKHKQMIEMLVWGNPDAAPSSGGGCKLENLDPREVDVMLHADYETVVTGTEVNPTTGDLELTTKSIKACSQESSNIPLSYSTTDVVTNVTCVDGVVNKDYKQIKFIGSDVSGSAGSVPLTCTNPDNYDWKYIFENHIYDETWWNVDYYDITWPEGCTPCSDPEPTGCCTATAYPTGTSGITQADCEAESGYVSWVEGDCDGCTGDDCCECGTMSDVSYQSNCPPSPGGPGGGSTVWEEFEQDASVLGNTSCTWSVPGTWTDSNGNTTTGNMTVTHTGGGNFTLSGSTPDGDTVAGYSNGTATTSACGSAGSWTYSHDNEGSCT